LRATAVLKPFGSARAARRSINPSSGRRRPPSGSALHSGRWQRQAQVRLPRRAQPAAHRPHLAPAAGGRRAGPGGGRLDGRGDRRAGGRAGPRHPLLQRAHDRGVRPPRPWIVKVGHTMRCPTAASSARTPRHYGAGMFSRTSNARHSSASSSGTASDRPVYRSMRCRRTRARRSCPQRRRQC